MADNGLSVQDKNAYDSIVDKLIRRNLRSQAKLTDIDEYDGESNFGNTTLYPGCIYIFQYMAKTPSIYDDGKQKFTWFDSLPIVLVTEIKNNIVSGINLNLCNMAIKTQVINTLMNLDINFYKDGAERMAYSGKRPYSEYVASVFMNQDKKKAFYEYITRTCQLAYTGFIYRTYSISNIRNPRMLEIWQYKYIPFLRYNGELKNEILTRIWNISGMRDNKI